MGVSATDKLCPYCHELRNKRLLMGGWEGSMYIEGNRIVFQTVGRPGNQYGDTARSNPIKFCPMCGRRMNGDA